MELNDFARAIIAPEDDNATLKSLDEFRKYRQYKIQGVFQADLQTTKGITQSNTTGLNPTTTKVHGSNTTAGSEVGVENISCTFATNDMSFDIVSLMQGLVKDETHDGYKRADKRLFKGVYIVVSENHGFPVYYVSPYCILTPGPGVSMQADAASPVTAHDSFIVTPWARPIGNPLYQVFVGDTNTDPAWKNEESMLEYIINGSQKTDPSH